MENTNIYHFNVPNTKLTYSVRLRYEGDFLRSFEVSNLIEGNRNVLESELTPQVREAYLSHLTDKMNKASIIRKK